MGRNTTMAGGLLLLALGLRWRMSARPSNPRRQRSNEVVIKNAVVMTVTHGNVKNGSVYIKDGKIAGGRASPSTRPPRPP